MAKEGLRGKVKVFPLAREEAVQKALAYFEGGYNWAESVLQVMQEVFGVEVSHWPAAGLGGGIGRCQTVCGAISGGVVALGLKGEAGSPDKDAARARAREDAKSLYRGFERAFIYTDCRRLTGYDFSTSEGYEEFHKSDAKQTKCHKYVSFVVGTLVDMEKKGKKRA